MGCNKYQSERKDRVRNRTVVFEDKIHTPTRSEKNETIQKALAHAEKQLADSIAEKDRAKIKRARKILENMQEMAAREQSRNTAYNHNSNR